MTRRRSFQNGCLMKRNAKWVIRWRELVPTDDGQLRWKHKAETLGLVRTLTKGEAEAILRERLGELSPLAESPTRDTEFSEFLDRWQEESLPNKSLSTQCGYRKIVSKHLRPFFGPYSLRELNPSLVQRFVQERVKSGLTPQTTRNIYNTLRAILHFGKRLKYLKENPADGVELPRRAETERTALRPEDVLAILDAFRADRISCCTGLVCIPNGFTAWRNKRTEVAGR
jgi:integrase-like protein